MCPSAWCFWRKELTSKRKATCVRNATHNARAPHPLCGEARARRRGTRAACFKLGLPMLRHADALAPWQTGSTPLKLAANGGHASLCMALLEKGADVNTKDRVRAATFSARRCSGSGGAAGWGAWWQLSVGSVSPAAPAISICYSAAGHGGGGAPRLEPASPLRQPSTPGVVYCEALTLPRCLRLRAMLHGAHTV
jgi:hypothetical protein